eukprot:2628703-Amphidinium_carterae.2
MAIHHRWCTVNKTVHHGEHRYGGWTRHRPIFLMVWRQSVGNIRRWAMEHSMHNASICFRRGPFN